MRIWPPANLGAYHLLPIQTLLTAGIDFGWAHALAPYGLAIRSMIPRRFTIAKASFSACYTEMLEEIG